MINTGKLKKDQYGFRATKNFNNMIKTFSNIITTKSLKP
jgi:hypothetical protein